MTLHTRIKICKDDFQTSPDKTRILANKSIKFGVIHHKFILKDQSTILKHK
jgi:hypothetical protein